MGHQPAEVLDAKTAVCTVCMTPLWLDTTRLQSCGAGKAQARLRHDGESHAAMWGMNTSWQCCMQ